MRKILITMPVLLLLVACGGDLSENITSQPSYSFAEQESPKSLSVSKKRPDPTKNRICPETDYKPDIFEIDRDEPGVPFVDKLQDIKDLGTELVVNYFFTTPQTLFNFMKLVYSRLDSTLATYRKEHGLEDRSMYLLFKGGNVLRMVANEVFALLTPEARKLLYKEFSPYFKRADADFIVYLDEQKLGGKDYERTLNEVTELLFGELGKIREEFQANTTKYFNFMQLDSDYGMKELAKYFEQLPAMPSLRDQKNTTLYKAKFSQLQFREYRALPGPVCFYNGQFDYRFDPKEEQIIATPKSDKPHWIANTDNRTLKFTWGTDPNKIVKFYLLRSKVMFEYTLEKDGVLKRIPIGGELIDLSLPHKDDARLREFLDNYDRYVAEYTLVSQQTGEQFTMKAYSLEYLAKDLQFIIFDSFDRPWQGGSKYIKRINRIFFLFIAEILNAYGLGSTDAKKYVQQVQDEILTPLNTLYPLKPADAQALVTRVKGSARQLADRHANLPLINDFWRALGEFIESRLIKNPQDTDQKGFSEFLKSIEKNMDIAKQLGDMQPFKVDTSKINNVELKHLF